MKFWKMSGAGNDFVILNGFTEHSNNWNETAKKLCDRHFGVGADGIEFCEKSDIADIRMKYYNSDGSLGEMCGNGIRCFAKFVYDNGIIKKENFSVDTDAGIKYIELIFDDNKNIKYVSVDMGKGDFTPSSIPCILGKDGVFNEKIEIGGKIIEFSSILMSVPHTVIFVEDIDSYDIDDIGSKLEISKIFPNKTNVNFAYIKDDNTIILKTWERGAGHTLACGTGCCATAVLAKKLGKINENEVKLIVEGGELFIKLDENYQVTMTGTAEKVFEGEIFI
ncbi:MAG: diaminopimelate epimerase [Fusobacteriaceae bacterium]|jgi:diaminopimelate epimerase|nr:diaminopimelate epimerase [Fusobacteriaceae bacterium]